MALASLLLSAEPGCIHRSRQSNEIRTKLLRFLDVRSRKQAITGEQKRSFTISDIVEAHGGRKPETFRSTRNSRGCFEKSGLAAPEVGEAALGHRLDALLEVLGAAQPVLFDELALGGGLDFVAQPAAHRLARRH